jgi:hypothetical protein
MRSSTMLPAALIAIAIGLVHTPVALAAAPTLRQAKHAAITAADRETNRFGIDYPASAWFAGCERRTVNGSRRWVCGVYTDTGQCWGSLHVVGTRRRPVSRNVRVSCGE